MPFAGSTHHSRLPVAILHVALPAQVALVANAIECTCLPAQPLYEAYARPHQAATA